MLKIYTTTPLFYFFLLKRNSNPINIIGREIIRKVSKLWYVLKKQMENNPRKIKRYPPISSFFQAKAKAIAKTMVGMLCIKNPPVFSRNVPSVERTSKENMRMKKMNNTASTLGSQ
jgi:hypothetical protein